MSNKKQSLRAVAQCSAPKFDETQYNETKAVLSNLEQSLKALTNK